MSNRPQSVRRLSALALLLLPASAPTLPQAADDDPPTRDELVAGAIGGWLQLPDEPYGRVWAAIGRDTVPTPPGDALALLEANAFQRGATWRFWAETLARVSAAGTTATPEDRVALALAAAGHRRQDDAWHWLASVGPAHPQHVAGVLAYLLPGVPTNTPLGPGGRPAALPADVLLEPLAPPRDPALPTWQVVWREARFFDLGIGAVVTDGVVKIEGTGSEVRFDVREGRPTPARVLLPGEVGMRVSSRYVDWERQPDPQGPDRRGAALPVVLTPATGAEGESEDAGEHVLWGRFRERDEQRPALPAHDAKLAQLTLGGLALQPGPGSTDEERALIGEVAGALAGLLEIDVRVGADFDEGPFAPIVIHVPSGPEGSDKLAWLASMVERRSMSSE